LKTKFPKYDYSDLVAAQHLLVTQGLGIQHVRLIIGQSMGGMHTWLWGTKYPEYMDILVPMAAQPTPMASRNWMLRRMMIDMIRNDPEYNDGNYTQQPRSMKLSAIFYGIELHAAGLLSVVAVVVLGIVADHIDHHPAQHPIPASHRRRLRGHRN